MKKFKYFFHKKGITLEGDITFETVSEIISCNSYKWYDLVDNKADAQLDELKKTIRLIIYATTGYDTKGIEVKNQFKNEPFILDLKNINMVDSIGLISLKLLLIWLNDELNINTIIPYIPVNMLKIIKLYNKTAFFSQYIPDNNKLIFK